MAGSPIFVTVRMYQVGFGDCLLLSFGYRDSTERHMLLDFGSTSRADGAPTTLGIAKSIAERTGGALDVLVVSHRHRDHLSGFGVARTRDAIAALHPKLVVLPWTERPEEDEEAREPANASFLKALTRSRSFAAAVDGAAPAKGTGSGTELVRAAREEIGNAAAVEWLVEAAKAASAAYAHAEQPDAEKAITRFLPGVKVEILGPPTPTQWPEVQHQRADDDDEYWVRTPPLLSRYYAADASKRIYGEADAEVPLPTSYARSDPLPGPDRWIAARIRRHELVAMTNIVRWLDDALNNTSLILLIEAPGKRLLLPGDAQIENWGWTLNRLSKERALKKRLSNVDLYKVGHHGSRNGTPPSLLALWANRDTERGRMVALMSTRAGVHGSTDATAVPRQTLVQALIDVADVYTTEGTAASFVEAVGLASQPGFDVKGAAALRTPVLPAVTPDSSHTAFARAR